MSELYHKFLSSGFGELNKASRQHIIDLYRHNYGRFLPKNKAVKILDIGSGMGQFLEFLAEEGYQDILGVDVSKEAVEYCLERGISRVKLISDLRNFLVGSAMYDLIVLNDVIEHFPREEVLPILSAIYEKLNAGGAVLVKTGNLASLVGVKICYNDFTHQSGFTEFSLAQVLKFSGFQDMVIYPFVFPKNRLTRVIRWLVQKKIHCFWKLIYFFEFTAPPRIVDELIFAVGGRK
ncbi:class I SAM-dependent methyltransferase [Candidatus Falkowbacteria bacterium]|nr:class I SAM-dependent methyltransferase [Candidatus Falkowbacteria bacterium]